VPGTVQPGAAPNPNPPESAKGKLFTELEKKAGGASARPAAKPEKPAAAEKPAEKPAAAKPAEGEAVKPGEGEALAPEAPELDEAAAAAATPEGKELKKGSPWKLVKDYKERVTALESEVLELKKGGVKPEERTALEERATKAETRAKELEQYLTYVDYSQTEDFKTKFVQPYEKAWGRAMEDIKELTVPDGSGGERAVNAQDLLQLVNMPLARARQLATEIFGEFADDVMQHRKEIRGLYEAQSAALEDAKKNGSEKLKQAREQQAAAQAAIGKTVKELWDRENNSIVTNEKYKPFFTPREGDEQWNSRLQKGYELVDKAFSENPANPNLKPEEREAAVRRHAAVRNRAASWGALRGEVERLSAELKKAQEELSQYKESEPGSEGARKPAGAAAPGSGNAKTDMFNELKKRAK
jgi:hypothetical protein